MPGILASVSHEKEGKMLLINYRTPTALKQELRRPETCYSIPCATFPPDARRTPPFEADGVHVCSKVPGVTLHFPWMHMSKSVADMVTPYPISHKSVRNMTSCHEPLGYKVRKLSRVFKVWAAMWTAGKTASDDPLW